MFTRERLWACEPAASGFRIIKDGIGIVVGGPCMPEDQKLRCKLQEKVPQSRERN